MSNAALNYIAQIQAPPSEKLLLWAIANRTDKTGRCWPSRKTLIADTGLSLASIKRGLAQLERKCILRRTEQRSEGGRKRLVVIELLAISRQGTEKPERGSQRAPHGAHADTGGGLKVTPGRGSPCAPLYKEEPKYEPSFEPANATAKNRSEGNGREFWTKAVSPVAAPEDLKATLVDGKLTLHGVFRAEWLEQFDGDEKRLSLALKSAANYVQLYGSKTLDVQVSAQLARAVGEKLDKDARYAAAAKVRLPSQHRPLSRFGVST